ncbi:longitudinals lacking protein, isoforms F/I/K/T-like isoform X1 [Chironomus tepperi]|uniref:longitudinals lacking protein, isoforms F/I/K/T-like isoform X1 n=1 Tax=Chironomus tepperi TaxID=113505 RepID=UPI00391F5417
MDDDQQFCLRWNNHQSTLISVFDTLLENGTLVDCTLAAEGKFLKAHKVVLSACSPYFAALLSQQYDKHPIFILKDVKFQELRAMMDYMYRGEVNISQDQLAALLKAAESLQIKGLSDSRGGGGGNNNSTNTPSQAHKSDVKQHIPVPPKASGLTIENKRPLLRTDFDAEVSGSREGSVSPSTRKRKKVNQRRKSLAETNNLLDNHDQHSNSSSHSNNQQQQLSTSATSAPTNNLSVTNNKKTEQDGNNQEHDEDNAHNTKRLKQTTDDSDNNKQDTELMIEPKNEYDDDDEDDENVEDLTMDDDMMEDLDQAGPSHGGEGSSQGYHWQMDGRNQESQEGSGQHRDAQGNKSQAFRFKLKDQSKDQQQNHDMNDCLLESENFQITKAENNKYLLLPVKKQPTEKIVLKECELVPVKRPQIKVTSKIEKSANVSIVQKVPESSQQQTITTIAPVAPIETEKKIVKPNHPRIKYSRHKNPIIIQSTTQYNQTQSQPIIQQQPVTQPLVHPVRTQVLSDGKKIEYISVTTVKPAEPVAKPIIIPASNTQQFVIQAVPTSGNQQITEYEVSAAANTSNQSNDFPNEIIDDLEYGIDDIELPEDVQIHFSDTYKSEDTENGGDASGSIKIKKYYATASDNSMASDGEEAGRQYECRHCGKRYRWKSTLRRHENVECGGKEASHQCPYCNYKAKQRGNLGVHIRKHHQDRPPLETRRSKKSLNDTR